MTQKQAHPQAQTKTGSLMGIGWFSLVCLCMFQLFSTEEVGKDQLQTLHLNMSSKINSNTKRSSLMLFSWTHGISASSWESPNKVQWEIGPYSFPHLNIMKNSRPESVKTNKQTKREDIKSSKYEVPSSVRIKYLTAYCIQSSMKMPISSVLMFYFSSNTGIPHTPAVPPQICTTLIQTIQKFQVFQLSQKITGASWMSGCK